MTAVLDTPPAEPVTEPLIGLDIYVHAHEKLLGGFNIFVAPHIEEVSLAEQTAARTELEQRAKELKRLQDDKDACPRDEPALLQRLEADHASASARYFEAKRNLENAYHARQQTRERSQRAMERLNVTATQVFPDLLANARAEFFESGPGAAVLERKERLRVAEEALAASQKELLDARRRWRDAVNTDQARDVEHLEKAIDTESKKELRLAARVPVLRAELDQCRKNVAPLLEPMLLQVRDEFIAAERLAELRAVVPEPLLAYLNALCRLEGGIGSSALIGKLRELKE